MHFLLSMFLMCGNSKQAYHCRKKFKTACSVSWHEWEWYICEENQKTTTMEAVQANMKLKFISCCRGFFSEEIQKQACHCADEKTACSVSWQEWKRYIWEASHETPDRCKRKKLSKQKGRWNANCSPMILRSNSFCSTDGNILSHHNFQGSVYRTMNAESQ